jgi:hypothetical protein
MTDNGEHRAFFGTPPKIERKRRPGKIHQQNKQHQDQYLPLQQWIDTISVTTNRSTHVFTKVNLDAPKPTDNVWIGTSHILLPTFWCSKCDSWSSHHDKLHDKRLQWQAMKNDQLLKQEEYRKTNPQNHYGPPHQQNS